MNNPKLISKISDVIGFELSKEESAVLKNKIDSVLSDLNMDSDSSLIGELSKNKIDEKIVTVLAKHFTVGETYFFRDKNFYINLEKELIKLINKRKNFDQRIKIWSAGCSSGEEIYSVLFLLDKLIDDLDDWKITLYGTDINQTAINKANDGIYSDWSFRATKNLNISKYFSKSDKYNYKLKDSYKQRVVFRLHNLLDNFYPSAIENLFEFDFIICRNVLMYFTKSVRDSVTHKLFNSLRTGGMLFVGAIEAGHLDLVNTKSVANSFSSMYIKSDSQTEIGNIESYKKLKKTENELSLKFKEIPKPKIIFTPAKQVNEIKFRDESKKLINEKLEKNIDRERIKTLYSENKYSEVEKFFELNDELNTRDEELVEYYLRACLNRRQFDKVYAKVEHLIDKDKTNPAFHFILGNLLFETGKVDEALKAYMTTNYLDEDHVMSLIAIGNILILKKEPDKGMRYLQHALDILKNQNEETIIDEIDHISAHDFINIIESVMAIENEKMV